MTAAVPAPARTTLRRLLPSPEQAVRLGSVLVMIVSTLVLVAALPVQQLFYRVRDIGWEAGPLGFAAAYVLVVLLFLPSPALNFIAGMVFGFWGGFGLVLVAFMIVASIHYGTARFIARDVVQRWTARDARLRSLDEAIGRDAWRTVLLVRLSPPIPSFLASLVFGASSVRFGPFFTMTFFGRMPATAMAVYFGVLGQNLIVGGIDSTVEWVVVTLAVAVTLLAVFHLGRLARRAVRSADAPRDIVDQPVEKTMRRYLTPFVAALAVAMATAAFFAEEISAALIAAQSNKVTMTEAYEEKPDGPTFDHSTWDALLKQHVTPERGLVDYEAIRANHGQLDAYLNELALADFEALGRDEKLALLINAYNAFTIKLIIEHMPLQSIFDIPPEKRWSDKRWNLGGQTVSLDQIEHEMIRPNFIEPNIHWAVVCAAIGCPPLRNEAYTGARVEAQLAEQAKYVHTHEPWFSFDPAAGEQGVVTLTPLYQWYGHDFEQVMKKGGVLAYAAQHNDKLAEALKTGKKPKIAWAEYNWALNDQAK